MKHIIQALLDLQNVDHNLLDVRSRIAAVPQSIAEVEATLPLLAAGGKRNQAQAVAGIEAGETMRDPLHVLCLAQRVFQGEHHARAETRRLLPKLTLWR